MQVDLRTDPAELGNKIPEPSRLRELIHRYSGPGPRYTSYPTVPEWSAEFGPEDYRRALAACDARSVSLYVHVPFCERLCSFCACNRMITQDHEIAGPFLDRIEREVAQVADALGSERAQVQLAIGGGSPNFLRTHELDRLIRIVDARFPPEADAERSIELDPRRTQEEQLELLMARGFNRVSFGVQDLDEKVQQAINRHSRPERLAALMDRARKLGAKGINFDLIYGLPEQNVASFQETLRKVLELRPDRIALYGYAHVTWISKAQRSFEKKDLPTPDLRLAIFAAAIERLCGEGYRYLGMDHFALPEDSLAIAADEERLTRNFMGYTVATGDALLAFGPSGISELDREYAQSEKDPEAWAERIDQGGLPIVRGLTLSDDDVERRWLIRKLLCAGRISDDDFAKTFGVALRERIPGLDRELGGFVADGLLEADDGGYRVTPAGRLFLRPLAMTFDAYLKTSEDAPRRYSATV
ncbi:MAG: oxygen-independent coproporphyrinogen III oxidase [Deltaproteobacteria bacterium]|nr:oxygen-independent coproporphyrinogen III oxidase [Deltaproteobacteria bacterium]